MALVVTVVVLLILAGITLVYVLGDNGVFSKAQDAKNRTENAIEDEKEYMNGIGNTINKYTNGTGGGTITPPTPEGPTISDSSSTSHTATTINYTWEQINKIAQAIAKSDNVNGETMEVTANIDGTECTIGVGDIAIVKYQESETSEVERRVRVLGFKHDDLVNKGAYGSEITANKASISFEFLDFMTGNTYMAMNANNSNANGWGSSDMRRDLNGYTKDATTGLIADAQSGAIGGLGAKLSNKQYIKQVKKSYIKEYDNANSIYKDNDSTKGKHYAQDYLWLLAASEVVPQNSSTDTKYANAITTEGNQYKYYQGVEDVWTANVTERVKYNASGDAFNVWLRSPYYDSTHAYCGVSGYGNLKSAYDAEHTTGETPGFCI